MERLWRDDKLCDLVLRAASACDAAGASAADAEPTYTEVKVHAVVAAAVSKPLEGMIVGPMASVREGVLTLGPGAVDGAALLEAAKFMYTGSFEVGEDTVFSLLAAANYLGLDGMKGGCAKVMLENLTPQNALGLLEALTQYACAKESIEEAEASVAAAFEEVAQEDEWVALDEAAVRSWLSRSDLRMKSEAAAFDALVRWTEHRPAEREGSFASLFGAVVRLPQLSTAELEAVRDSPRGAAVEGALLDETLRREQGGRSRHRAPALLP